MFHPARPRLIWSSVVNWRATLNGSVYVVDASLAVIPQTSREMVEVMACLGGRADVSVLAIASGEQADVVQRVLAPALAEGVLVAEIGVRDGVRFRHDRIREAILAELRALLHSGVKRTDKARYARLLVTYESKLARPFACLVFTLLAIPLGIRPQRSSSGAGFGISIAIVFAFYITTTVCLAIGQSFPGSSLVMAWLPNIILSPACLSLLRRAAWSTRRH